MAVAAGKGSRTAALQWLQRDNKRCAQQQTNCMYAAAAADKTSQAALLLSCCYAAIVEFGRLSLASCARKQQAPLLLQLLLDAAAQR